MKLFNYLSKSENSVAIMLTIAIISMAYPYGFPLFSSAALFLVFLKIIYKKFKIRINMGFTLFFLCTLVYLIGLGLNKGVIYDNNLSDLRNIVGFFLAWVLMSDLERRDYPDLIYNFARLTVITSTVISLVGLYKFYNLLNGVTLSPFFVSGSYYPPGTSLVRDYNMFSFSLTCGLVMCLFLLNKSQKNIQIFYYIFSFVCMISAVIFTGSRRGWIVAIIIIIFIVISSIKLIAYTNKNLSKIVKVGFAATFILSLAYMSSILFDINIDFDESNQIKRIQNRLESLQFTQSEGSFSDRTDRWNYSLELLGQYNPAEIVFGSGFDYLPKYATEFYTSVREDYPHNPFLSSFLYSGLLGLIILISLLVYTAIKALSSVNVLGINFIFLFFLSWMFVFVSGNSIFSITLFVLFVLLVLSIPKRINKQIPCRS